MMSEVIKLLLLSLPLVLLSCNSDSKEQNFVISEQVLPEGPKTRYDSLQEKYGLREDDFSQYEYWSMGETISEFIFDTIEVSAVPGMSFYFNEAYELDSFHINYSISLNYPELISRNQIKEIISKHDACIDQWNLENSDHSKELGCCYKYSESDGAVTHNLEMTFIDLASWENNR